MRLIFVTVLVLAIFPCALGQEKPSSAVIKAVDDLLATVAFSEIQGDTFLRSGTARFTQADRPWKTFRKDRGIWFVDINSRKLRTFDGRAWEAWKVPQGADFWRLGIVRVSSGPRGLVATFEERGIYGEFKPPRVFDIRATRP